MPKTLNGFANILLILALIGLTVAGVTGSFSQGWNVPQIIAANSLILMGWAFIVGWVAIQMKKVERR